MTKGGGYSPLKQAAEAGLRGNTGKSQGMISAKTDEVLRYLHGRPRTHRASNSSKRPQHRKSHARFPSGICCRARQGPIYGAPSEEMPQPAFRIYISRAAAANRCSCCAPLQQLMKLLLLSPAFSALMTNGSSRNIMGFRHDALRRMWMLAVVCNAVQTSATHSPFLPSFCHL